jgi:DNA-binding NarL/FixJ family response regulator
MTLMMPDSDVVEVKSGVSILIVARSDRARDSLHFLLAIESWIEVVGLTDEEASALEMIRQHCPALVILDPNLSDDQTWLRVLAQIKVEAPQTRCLVLTNTLQKQQAAKAGGADAVLIKGFPLARLFATIRTLSSV